MNCAPACEYVAIPDGSSSLAPVTKPAPKILKAFLIFIKNFADIFIYFSLRYLLPSIIRKR